MNIVNNYTESLSEKGWLLHQLESCQQISFIYWPLQEGPQFKRSTLVKVKVKAKGAQSCPSLCDPIDCPPATSVHGILQARILEWVAIPFSRGSSQLRDRTWAYMNCRQILYSLSHQGSTRKCLSISYNISSALISLFPPSVTSVYFLLYHFVFSNNSQMLFSYFFPILFQSA